MHPKVLTLPAAMLLLSGVALAQQPPALPLEVPQQLENGPTVPPQPKPELERPTVWGEPTEVQIGIYIVDVDEIDSANQRFSASVFYQAQWQIPSLVHKGPGPLNRGLTEVWNPRLAIVNQQQAWNAYPGFVEITPSGEVSYRQKVWGWFSQPLDLHEFPFDQQILSVHIAAAGLLEKDVRMVSHEWGKGRSSGIARQFSLPDFKVVSWRAEPKPYIPLEGVPGTSGFEMQIVVKRNVTYYVMKVIIPLCLIVVMSWIPRWIDLEQVGTNIGISTSAFLTLVAYLFAINLLLPRVSYVTRMDWFILVSTLTVFTGLLHTVVNAVLVKNEKTKHAVRIDWWARGVYPILLAAVLVWSFVL